ncbi:MAG: asparaginase domain-containing protein [Acidimicrobiia bacterium]|nr:asparaginase domain-containing protein [Acidimicrobiia bacterium]
MHITIITTGGTLDKVYFDANSEFQVGDPGVAELLAEANVTVPYTIVSLMRKDSLDLTDDDRRAILRHVAEAEADRIVITHGTDTMVDTARVLLGVPDKTIVLTGSMQPARLRVSDAAFNVGAAVLAAQTLDPGVYIVMNGRVHDPRRTHKNRSERRFEDD